MATNRTFVYLPKKIKDLIIQEKEKLNLPSQSAVFRKILKEHFCDTTKFCVDPNCTNSAYFGDLCNLHLKCAAKKSFRKQNLSTEVLEK